MTKKLLIALVVGLFVVLAQSASASSILPQEDPLVPDKDGLIHVALWSVDKPTPKAWATDAMGKVIEAPNWPKVGFARELPDAGTPPKPKQKLWLESFHIDAFVILGKDPQTGKALDVAVKDAKVRWFDSTGIELAQIDIESTSQDPASGEYQLDNIFGVLAANRGFETVSIPLLFGDTNADGELGGSGDLLYNLVDLRLYLGAPPIFNSGDIFTISNGTASALPGMLFSTSPFTFNSLTGFSGTPYSGTAYVGGELSAAAVPELGTLALVGTFMLPVVRMIRGRRMMGSAGRWIAEAAPRLAGVPTTARSIRSIDRL
jgi:hypothetical protein